jgi:hypothetical protein
MQVEKSNLNKQTDINALRPGDTFDWNENICMKIYVPENSRVNAVRLCDGKVVYVFSTDSLIQVNYKAVQV